MDVDDEHVRVAVYHSFATTGAAPPTDALARFGREIPKWNVRFVRALGTDLMTVRIDLDDPT